LLKRRKEAIGVPLGVHSLSVPDEYGLLDLEDRGIAATKPGNVVCKRRQSVVLLEGAVGGGIVDVPRQRD
jgi:hypothetical protein